MKNIIFFFLAFILCSCSDLRMRYEVFKAIGRAVYINEDMQCIYKGEEISQYNLKDKPIIMLAYYDSTFCTSCQASELFVWNHFIELQSDNFQIVFIFQAETKDLESVKEVLKIMCYEFPVFIDEYGTFQSDNKDLPLQYTNFHFLLLKDRKISLVGLPLGNKKLSAMYEDIIKTN